MPLKWFEMLIFFVWYAVSRYKTWGLGCLDQFDILQTENSSKLKKSTTSKDLVAVQSQECVSGFWWLGIALARLD